MALVLHELAVNASKYGALSRAEGRIRIDWSIQGGQLDLQWKEFGGPLVKQPLQVGFGSRLIDISVSELGGILKRDYAESGLICRIGFPIKESGYDEIQSEYEPSSRSSDTDHGSLQGRKVLLIEDQALISDDLIGLLQGFGMSTIGPATSISTGLALLENANPDVAILDVNLNGEFAFPIADALKARGIPFFFVTGYGDPDIWPEHLRDSLRLTKPIQRDGLLHALSIVMGPRNVVHPTG